MSINIDYLPTVTGTTTVNGTFYDNTLSTVSTSMNYCTPCGTYWWYPTVHTCYHAHSAHEHDYQQADGAFNDTLYCRKCGETKRLKSRQMRKAE